MSDEYEDEIVSEDVVTPADGKDTHQKHAIRDLASRLYQGEAGIDVVGKRKIFYGVAAAIVLIFAITLWLRPFNLGIEFKGGNSFTVPASVGSLSDVRGAVEEYGGNVASAVRVDSLTGNGQASYQIKTSKLDPDTTVASIKGQEIQTKLATRYHIPASAISQEAVSGEWGASVTEQAVIGTLVFLVLVLIYLTAVFREWKMAAAALAALAQNLLLTATVYLLTGFEVTPSTVIGFLTIFGFALYDVVVVFDKVRENTRGIVGNPNRTYGEAANLAVNQTLMRSINTAIVALLPVGGLLVVGAGLLGAGTLKDLGLVLFVGMLAAVYSSIFFATPVLVDLKEAEPRFRAHKQRVLARRAGGGGEQRRAKPSTVRQTIPAGKKGTAAAAADTVPEDGALAGSAPRPGARPAARKRPGAAKPGGGKPGGARSGGGRKR
jgi:preprotein translocase subunit SecF